MNAQYILTGYLFLLLCTGIFQIARNRLIEPSDKTSHIVAGAIGHIMKIAIIFTLLWLGGFYVL